MAMDLLMVGRRMLLLQQQLSAHGSGRALQDDDDDGPTSPAAAGGIGTPSAPRTRTGILGLLTNGCFIAATVCFALAQLAKLFTHYYTERVWNFSRLVGSGGMPSSHTAFVVGLTTAVGLLEGTGSSVFALSLVVTLIVMYDATGEANSSGTHSRRALDGLRSLLQPPGDRHQPTPRGGQPAMGRESVPGTAGGTRAGAECAHA